MAKITRAQAKASLMKDLSQWNFVIFLTLALMLIVAVVTAMQSSLFKSDNRAKASGICPNIKTVCQEGETAFCYTGADKCQVCVCAKK